MWLTGVFGIATKYAEVYISARYRVKDHRGEMLSGAMYAWERAFKRQNGTTPRLGESGHKVSSITLGSSVESIGKHAFYKTSKLKTLNMRSAYSLFGYNSSSKVKTQGIAKGALSKCGKSGGKGLTVKAGTYGYDSVKKQTKKALVRVGLSSKAKVVR